MWWEKEIMHSVDNKMCELEFKLMKSLKKLAALSGELSIPYFKHVKQLGPEDTCSELQESHQLPGHTHKMDWFGIESLD